jgi:hypothetical protein
MTPCLWLMSAETSVALNFGVPAAVQWADRFMLPTEVWERDGMSLLRHDMSLESLLYEFHELRRDSYLSPESVLRSLGTTSCSRFTGVQAMSITSSVPP